MTSHLSTKTSAAGINVPGLPNPGPAADSGTTDFRADLTAMPAKLCSLPPLNSIASRVLAVSDDPDSDTRALASVVESDPAFAAEVLFLANSPLFGFPSKLHALPHAVAILGVDRIKALVTTVAMRAFVGKGSPMIRQCWRHSTACAVIAERISAAFQVPGDQAYAAALLHDVGRLGLLKSYPQQMSPVMGGEHVDLREVLFAERAAIKVDHQSAGGWLVTNWGLPQPFFVACVHHHDSLRETDSPLLQVVKTACRMADTLGFAAVACQSTPAYTNLVADLPNSVKKDRLPAEEEFGRHVEERLASLEN